jgi:hypothetical protein
LPSRSLERRAGREKNGKPVIWSYAASVAAPHLTLRGLRGTVSGGMNLTFAGHFAAKPRQANVKFKTPLETR